MALSIKVKQNRVRKWIKSTDTGRTNLYFVKKNEKGKYNSIEIKSGSIDSMVMSALELSNTNYSARKEGESLVLETTPGRSRSAYDLWRHIKTYKPSVSIYQVMEAIYSINKKLYVSYCTTVMRTVVSIRPGPEIIWENNCTCREFSGKHAKGYDFSFSDSKKMVNKKGGSK